MVDISAQCYDVCVVCALPEEARAFLAVVGLSCEGPIEERFSPQHRYAYRTAIVKNTQGEALTLHLSWLPRYGPQEMTLHLERVLQEYQPRVAVMTGICAGDAERVQLGDLVVAERIYTYDNGRFVLDEQGQPIHLHDTLTYQLDATLLQYLHLFDAWKPLVAELQRPCVMSDVPMRWSEVQCHLKPMASGTAVRADHPFADVQVPVRGTVAIDMEGAAFGLVMSRHPVILWLVVKSVCDYADGDKNDLYHNYAARASALYALSFVRAYVTDRQLPRSGMSSSANQAGPLVARNEPGSAPTFQVQNQQLVQRQIIGDHATVHQHDYSTSPSAPSLPTLPQRVLPEPLWNLPFPRNPFFTGRETELKQLHTRLHQNVTVVIGQTHAISGPRGIGKTQLAVEYAYRYYEGYQYLLWARAESTETLTSSFVELARLLDLPEKDEQEQNLVVQAVKRWLQREQGWLLILDNADTPDLLPDFLPQTFGGHLLITTRAADVDTYLANLTPPLEVDTLSDVQGALKTYRYDVAISYAGEDRPYAESLAQALHLRGLRVFYDRYEKSTLWGKNLYDHLSDVYQHQAHYCIMLLSQSYSAKVWTTHERQAAQNRAVREKEEYILPIRLDDTELSGHLQTLAYLDWHEETVETITIAILEKLGRTARTSSSSAAVSVLAPQKETDLASAQTEEVQQQVAQVGSISIPPRVQQKRNGTPFLTPFTAEKLAVLHTLIGHTDYVVCVALSADGETLVSGGWDRKTKVWNLSNGQEVRTLTGHTARVRSVAISTDGETLVSGSEDKTIKVWNLSSGQEVRTLTDHRRGSVNSVSISADGTTLASGSGDDTIKVWSVSSNVERILRDSGEE